MHTSPPHRPIPSPAAIAVRVPQAVPAAAVLRARPVRVRPVPLAGRAGGRRLAPAFLITLLACLFALFALAWALTLQRKTARSPGS